MRRHPPDDTKIERTGVSSYFSGRKCLAGIFEVGVQAVAERSVKKV